MMRIEDITEKDIIKNKKIFVDADILGMTTDEAVKIIDGDEEKVLFVCGPVWMLFWNKKDKSIGCQTFMVNEEGKVVTFVNDDYDYQVRVFDNMIYLIYGDGRHESLQFFKNSDNPEFEVSSNGFVAHMQYDPKRDVRCFTKYEHVACGDSNIIYNLRLKSPYEVTIETSVSKRDKGIKFLGRKDSFYRLDFDARKNKWQYDLATMKELGVKAVMANDTISLNNGVTEFSKFYKVLFSVGDYFTLTGFPFFHQYSSNNIMEYVKSMGFSSSVSEKLVELYNNKNKTLEIL